MAPPSSPLSSVSTSPSPPDDDEETMTESIKRFWGDDEHNDEVPEDFVNTIEILFLQKPNTPDAQKL
jgi:hypothetical protein